MTSAWNSDLSSALLVPLLSPVKTEQEWFWRYFFENELSRIVNRSQRRRRCRKLTVPGRYEIVRIYYFLSLSLSLYLLFFFFDKSSVRSLIINRSRDSRVTTGKCQTNYRVGVDTLLLLYVTRKCTRNGLSSSSAVYNNHSKLLLCAKDELSYTAMTTENILYKCVDYIEFVR